MTQYCSYLLKLFSCDIWRVSFSLPYKKWFIPSILSILPITRQNIYSKDPRQALRVFNIDSPKTSLKQIYPFRISWRTSCTIFFLPFFTIFSHFLPRFSKIFIPQIFALLLDKIVPGVAFSSKKNSCGIFPQRLQHFFVWVISCCTCQWDKNISFPSDASSKRKLLPARETTTSATRTSGSSFLEWNTQKS